MFSQEIMEACAGKCQAQLRQLIRDLCAIPAPSGREERRAEFCLNWFRTHCTPQAFVDEALNVICPWGGTEGGSLTVVMAHTDTVFPDLEPMAFSEDETRFYCPGVTDDTAQLAVMMVCARELMAHCTPPDTGIVFVANACEEGLGNLKGCRKIMETYGGRVKEFVTLDGTSLTGCVSRAVGSHRWRVTVSTEGGHSFNAFGNANAIHLLSGLVTRLYEQPVPEKEGTKTTYNVGMISGGTSVNTIAQEASLLYEYRSDDRACLAQMEARFRDLIHRARARGIRVETEQIGCRPCGGPVDPVRQEALLERAAASIRKITGREPEFRSGSTDCNIPLSQGIPAVCIGACAGGGCHTREEYLELDSLQDGCRLVLDFLYTTLYQQ